MLESSFAPYLFWAKTCQPAAIDLAGSNLLHCTMDELPGVRDAFDITAPNDNGYAPVVDAIAAHYGVARDRVATAAGCSGANFIAVAALAGTGDDVLVEQPTYDPLLGICQLMGARVRGFSRRAANGFAIESRRTRVSSSSRARTIRPV